MLCFDTVPQILLICMTDKGFILLSCVLKLHYSTCFQQDSNHRNPHWRISHPGASQKARQKVCERVSIYSNVNKTLKLGSIFISMVV